MIVGNIGTQSNIQGNVSDGQALAGVVNASTNVSGNVTQNMTLDGEIEQSQTLQGQTQESGSLQGFVALARSAGVSEDLILKVIEAYFAENPIEATTNYPALEEKPKINGIELIGDKSAEDLGLQEKGDYLTEHQDLSEYAKTSEIPTKISDLKNDSGFITAEEIPTAPEIDLSGYATEEFVEEYAQPKGDYLTEHQSLEDYAKKEEIPQVPVWAMNETKPTYTASEVGADVIVEQAKNEAKTHTNTEISNHNVTNDSHNDIRIFINELTARVNALADSDDTTLDQMSEVVAYIKDNRDLIEQVTTNKVNITDIIDNLTTNLSTKVLSASMGVQLKQLIDAIVVPTKVSELTNDAGYLTEHQSLAGYATEEWVEGKGYLTEHQDISGKLNTADLIDYIYPVGSIYMSVNNISPTAFIGGTWEQIQDRFLLAAGDTYVAGDVGGSEVHLHEYQLGVKTYYGSPIGSDSEMLQSWDYETGAYKDAERDGDADNPKINTGLNAANKDLGKTCYQQKVVGNTKTETNMPPYLTVYIWKRTA